MTDKTARLFHDRTGRLRQNILLSIGEKDKNMSIQKAPQRFELRH